MFNNGKLKKLMTDNGVSERKLADAVGVGQPFINHVLQGFRQPQLAVAVRIADYFGVTVDDLVKKGASDESV